MNVIVKRIYELITESGISKKTLAEKIGVSRNTITNWKKHDSMPALPVIEKLCQAFNITVEQFFSGIGNKKIEKAQRDFINSWRMLSPKERAVVSSVIQTFKDIRTNRYD